MSPDELIPDGHRRQLQLQQAVELAMNIMELAEFSRKESAAKEAADNNICDHCDGAGVIHSAKQAETCNVCDTPFHLYDGCFYCA